jgi:hypothetical protein
VSDKPPVGLTHRLMLDLIDMEDDATVAEFARKVIPGLIDDLCMNEANCVALTREVSELRRNRGRSEYCGRGLCAKLEGHAGRCDV